MEKMSRRRIPPFLIGLATIVAYVATRSLNIANLPVFGDEAEYTWYAQTALHDPAERFISLTVGKQPLFIWLEMFFMRVLPNPLLAGRIESIAAGLVTMIGIAFLSY